MNLSKKEAREKCEGLSEKFQIAFTCHFLKPESEKAKLWKEDIYFLAKEINGISMMPFGKRLSEKALSRWFLFYGIDDESDYERLVSEAVKKEGWTNEFSAKKQKNLVSLLKSSYESFADAIAKIIIRNKPEDVKKEINDLKFDDWDTLPLYKQRFIEEFYETYARSFKLNKMISKAHNGSLSFIPDCPIELLEEQAKAMQKYLEILEERAEKYENIDLNKYKSRYIAIMME